VINERLKAFTEDMALPDMATNVDELPWVLQGERVWFRPLRFDLTSGRWINLLKVEGGGKVNRHRHTGGHGLLREGLLALPREVSDQVIYRVQERRAA
jgi:anti-sigma factor ChrR (cupin superfamily)